MNIVWVLFAIVAPGNFSHFMIPTMEFDSREKCEAAIKTFREDTKERSGNFIGRCVRIEK